MRFPDVTVVPPVLADYAYELGGLQFGSGQSWAVQTADGLDLPKVRNGDVDRPLDSGQFEGLDYLSGRDITLTFHSQSVSDAALRTQLSALEALMLPPEDGITESWLWFQRPGNPLFVCGVRPRQFRLKGERKLSSIRVAQPIALLHATSAYVYGQTQSITANNGGIAAGFAFPLTFNLSFGGGGAVGILNAINTGVVSARPVFVFTGPIDTPTITNGSLTGNPFMTLNMVLAAGDQVVVDTDLDGPSVVFYAAGSTIGSSRLALLAPNSTPFRLQVGENKVVFTSQDSAATAGTCEVLWAPSYPIGI